MSFQWNTNTNRILQNLFDIIPLAAPSALIDQTRTWAQALLPRFIMYRHRVKMAFSLHSSP